MNIVIIAPMTDEANVYPWGSCNLTSLSQELIDKGEDVTLIYGSDATPAMSRATILDTKPDRIYSFGHGWPKGHTIEEDKPFFTVNGLNLDLVEGRTIHLLSCLCAQGPDSLGQRINEEGAKAFFGYKDTFMLMTWSGKEPCSCRFLTGCFQGDLEIERRLSGSTMDYKEIYNHAIEKYNEEIKYWEENFDEETCNSSAVSAEMAEMLISSLVHDRNALVCFYPLPVGVGGIVRANIVITNTFSYQVRKDLLVRFGVYDEVTGEFVSQFENVKADIELGLGETIGSVECTATNIGEWDCMIAIGEYDSARGIFDIKDQVVKKRMIEVI